MSKEHIDVCYVGDDPLWFFETPDSPSSEPTTNETDSDDFDYQEPCCEGYVSLITAASFPLSQPWFFLFIRWRKEAIRLLTKPRNTQARRQSQSRWAKEFSRGATAIPNDADNASSKCENCLRDGHHPVSLHHNKRENVTVKNARRKQ